MPFCRFYFVFSFLLCIHFVEASDKINVIKELQGIPEKDKEGLSDFFEELIIQQGSFGYTVFGDKPISSAPYSIPGTLTARHLFFPTLINGLELWDTYSILFPSKNFVFKRDHSIQQLYLINRKATLKAIEDNLDLFQQILGPEISPKTLLAEIEQNDSIIRDVLQGHEGLFGILLGFGRENSLTFQRREEVADAIYKKLIHPIQLSEEQVSAIQKYSNWFSGSRSKKVWSEELLEASLDDLIEIFSAYRKEFCGFNKEYDFLLSVRLPDFAAVQNTPETNELFEKYTKTQVTLANIYAKGTILEETLCSIVTE